MTVTRTSNSAAVEKVDAQTRSLYRRLRVLGPDYAITVGLVRALHVVLKDLRVEAADVKSPLNTASPDYAEALSHTLAPLLDDCDAAVKELTAAVDAIVENSTVGNVSPDGNFDTSVALVRGEILDYTKRLGQFLDEVDAHNMSGSGSSAADLRPSSISPMPSDDDELELIKNRINAIAERLSHQELITSAQLAATSTDELWQLFYKELLYEGFSTGALLANQGALRTYIQHLGSQGTLKGSDALRSTPHGQGTIQSFPLPVDLDPYSTPAPHNADESVQKEVIQPSLDSEKFHPAVKQSRSALAPCEYIPYRPPAVSTATPAAESPYSSSVSSQARLEAPPEQQQPVPSPGRMVLHVKPPQNVSSLPPCSPSPSLSAEADTPVASSGDDYDEGDHKGTHLITTRDLLAIDWEEHKQNVAGGGATSAHRLLQNGHPPLQLLPPPAIQTLSLPASAFPDYQSGPPQNTALIALPSTEMPAKEPDPVAFGIMMPLRSALNYHQTQPIRPVQHRPGYAVLLDSLENPIPSDAIWTKIDRRLVSPNVLDRAGVRYEAWPAFVAVLGTLDQQTIREYARQTAEDRRAPYASVRRRVQQPRDKPVDERRFSARACPADPSSRLQRVHSMPADISKEDGRDVDDCDEPDTWSARHIKASTFPISGRSADAGTSARTSTSASTSEEVPRRPIIVSPPVADNHPGRVSPSSPKSILKNKNTNQVRFKDGKLIEVGPNDSDGSSTETDSGYSHSHGHRDGGHRRRRERSRHGDRSRTRGSNRNDDRGHRQEHYGRSRDVDRSREREPESSHRRSYDDRRDRDRDRDRERESRMDSRTDSRTDSLFARKRRGSRSERENGDRNSHDHDYDRDSHDREGRDGNSHRRLRDTLSAASIGGVAGSLFSALVEAAGNL